MILDCVFEYLHLHAPLIELQKELQNIGVVRVNALEEVSQRVLAGQLFEEEIQVFLAPAVLLDRMQGSQYGEVVLDFLLLIGGLVKALERLFQLKSVFLPEFLSEHETSNSLNFPYFRRVGRALHFTNAVKQVDVQLVLDVLNGLRLHDEHFQLHQGVVFEALADFLEGNFVRVYQLLDEEQVAGINVFLPQFFALFENLSGIQVDKQGPKSVVLDDWVVEPSYVTLFQLQDFGSAESVVVPEAITEVQGVHQGLQHSHCFRQGLQVLFLRDDEDFALIQNFPVHEHDFLSKLLQERSEVHWVQDVSEDHSAPQLDFLLVLFPFQGLDHRSEQLLHYGSMGILLTFLHFLLHEAVQTPSDCFLEVSQVAVKPRANGDGLVTRASLETLFLFVPDHSHEVHEDVNALDRVLALVQLVHDYLRRVLLQDLQQLHQVTKVLFLADLDDECHLGFLLVDLSDLEQVLAQIEGIEGTAQI